MDRPIILSPYRPIVIQNTADIELMNFIKKYVYMFSRLEISPMNHLEMIRGLFNIDLCYNEYYEYYDNIKIAEELYIIYSDKFQNEFMELSCKYIFLNNTVFQNYYLTSKVYRYIINKDELFFIKFLKKYSLDYKKYINYFKGDKNALQSLFN